ncbi:hypothetical protein C922_05658 [Plasmodium inui San Antonio 1]|uniref:Uncharacterized protein n=1 Tax=Plasmodium inui San Antonio 1 TaxID=1237626 RepID=W6ZXC7_9APIC|nr:hypothetical protein C922_05658 [Plasmodium inui San Antonio 1]EUD63963.1 hypothetical protein C922_05658 [Plasmodium inui San Antonio 1]
MRRIKRQSSSPGSTGSTKPEPGQWSKQGETPNENYQPLESQFQERNEGAHDSAKSQSNGSRSPKSKTPKHLKILIRTGRSKSRTNQRRGSYRNRKRNIRGSPGEEASSSERMRSRERQGKSTSSRSGRAKVRHIKPTCQEYLQQDQEAGTSRNNHHKVKKGSTRRDSQEQLRPRGSRSPGGNRSNFSQTS